MFYITCSLHRPNTLTWILSYVNMKCDSKLLKDNSKTVKYLSSISIMIICTNSDCEFSSKLMSLLMLIVIYIHTFIILTE